MGNCIDLQKPILWVDEEEEEEWEAAEPPSPAHCREEEKTERVAAASATPAAEEEGSTEIKIKIKISKKQLEELLHQADEKGLPLNKVLADIVAMGGVCTPNRDRRWRPNLQSIPEVLSE
ncbi:hypothetical protein B296_00058335 [Ensete ventricosum]|uniref:Uncharacterized protein n=1 Tax=Ensete ventricosum TaxID=4639 RepID=A0A426XJW7_ENSVE|nr:hypothetical protein B296_00058335 [Ensete ventricosum]